MTTPQHGQLSGEYRISTQGLVRVARMSRDIAKETPAHRVRAAVTGKLRLAALAREAGARENHAEARKVDQERADPQHRRGRQCPGSRFLN
jgi:hypothetical protein